MTDTTNSDQTPAPDGVNPSDADSISGDGGGAWLENPDLQDLDYGVVAQQGPDANIDVPLVGGDGPELEFENPIIASQGSSEGFENPIIANQGMPEFENPIIAGEAYVAYPSIVGLEQEGVHRRGVFPSIVGIIAVIALLLLGGVGGYLMLTGTCLPMFPCDDQSALTGSGGGEEVLFSTEVPPAEPAAGSEDDSAADQSGEGSEEMDSETEIVEMATEEPVNPGDTSVNNPPPPPPAGSSTGGEEPVNALCGDNGGVQWQGETCVCSGFVDVVTICNDGVKLDNVTSTACTPDPAACAAGGGGGGEGGSSGGGGGEGGSCQPPPDGCPEYQSWLPEECSCVIIN